MGTVDIALLLAASPKASDEGFLCRRCGRGAGRREMSSSLWRSASNPVSVLGRDTIMRGQDSRCAIPATRLCADECWDLPGLPCKR